MPSTRPLQDIVAAFKAVLDAAKLGVSVYEEEPYPGTHRRCVVLTPVGGFDARSALNLQVTPNMRALEEHCRLQVDCYYDTLVKCRELVDKVAQVIVDHDDEFDRVYDIHDIRRVLGPIPGPSPPNVRETRYLMDFEFYTYRPVT